MSGIWAKTVSLLLLRRMGLLLILCGALRVMSPAAGPGLATKFHVLDTQSLRIGFSVAAVVIGLLVVVGLLRRISSSLQALILVPGVMILWRYLPDWMGMHLLDKETSQILYFPPAAITASMLFLLAFHDEDRSSLDQILTARRTKA